jgi:hypothetical protein
MRESSTTRTWWCWVFFANDFEGNLKAGLFGLDGSRRLVEKKYQHIPGVRIQNVIYSIPGVQWLSENSYFYSLLFNNVWSFFAAKLAQEAEYAVPAGAVSSGIRDTNRGYVIRGPVRAVPVSTTQRGHRHPSRYISGPEGVHMVSARNFAFAEYQVKLAAALIERMQHFCSERGIRLIVVDIPYILHGEPYRYYSSVTGAARKTGVGAH